MLMYSMLYIMLAYLMLFTALYNAVYLYNASFLSLTFTKAFCFHALPWVIDKLFVYFIYYLALCT